MKPFRSEALRHLKRLPEKNGSSDIAAFSTTHGDERKATTSIVPEIHVNRSYDNFVDLQNV